MKALKFQHDFLWNPDLGHIHYSPDRRCVLFTVNDIHPDCYGQTAYMFLRSGVQGPVLFKLREVANDTPTQPIRVQWSSNSRQVAFEMQDCGYWRSFECGIPRPTLQETWGPGELDIRFQTRGHRGTILIQ